MIAFRKPAAWFGWLSFFRHDGAFPPAKESPSPAGSPDRPVRYAVSACLCGKNCRYDGGSKPDESIKKFAAEHHALLICPESFVFRGTHPPSEITAEGRVVNPLGEDLTEVFRQGAEKTLERCLWAGITHAILKERSPSCGVHQVYDGTFSGKTVTGQGVAARLLQENEIQIMSEDDFHEGRFF